MQVSAQGLCQLGIGLFLGPVLLVDVQGLPGMVVAHAAKVVRVGVPAEVQTVIAAVKPGNLLAGDVPQLQILKHGGAAAHHLAQILVGVGHRVTLLQGLGVVEEAGAQPFGRGGQVGGVMPELLRLCLPLVPVDPMPRHGGRVESLEGKTEGTATEHRLLHVSHLFGAVVLVELFKVHHAEVAERYGDGL